MRLNVSAIFSALASAPGRAVTSLASTLARMGRTMSSAVAVGTALVMAAGVSMVLPNAFANSTAGGGLPSATAARAAVPVGMGQLAELIHQQNAATRLPGATSAPQPAPPSVTHAPPLRSHEVFAFAPYWTLSQSQSFDVSDLTTLAYFSVDVNPDGSFDTSGAGWNGLMSQALSDLITRAHSAGDRVVLTVTDFDQSSLDQITSDPSAAGRLADSILWAMEAKNLDGVNIDFEGNGGADQAGLTSLISSVSKTVHAANPHYQVTMDTYASSAGDPQGFYDVKALAPSVDGFFVMAYEQNLQSGQSAASPVTSGEFSDRQALQQYTRVVAPSKVIMGAPFYGEDFVTSDGTMAAAPQSGSTPLAYSQIQASGHPTYWDPVTDTAWTSYVSGGQWHETYFQDPTSLYMEAKMAESFGIDGMGIWALGMDGKNSGLVQALLGHAPARKDTLAGPTSTGVALPASTFDGANDDSPGGVSTGAGSGPAGAGGSASTPAGNNPGSQSTSPGTNPTSGGSSTTKTPPATTPPATTPPATTPPTTPAPVGSATYGSQTVQLWAYASSQLPTGSPQLVGSIAHFTTASTGLACLSKEPSVNVYKFASDSEHYFVLAAAPSGYPAWQIPPACTTATLYFPVPTSPSTTTTLPGATTTAPSTSAPQATTSPTAATATTSSPSGASTGSSTTAQP